VNLQRWIIGSWMWIPEQFLSSTVFMVTNGKCAVPSVARRTNRKPWRIHSIMSTFRKYLLFNLLCTCIFVYFIWI
jgi:hypothetical protein